MASARLIVWDDHACRRIHEATLALPEETGVEVLPRRHAPFVSGAGCGALDMRSGVDVYAVPEHFLSNAAATDLARIHGSPSFSYAGVADGTELDEQRAAEAAIALNEIDAVGPGGSHLGCAFTLEDSIRERVTALARGGGDSR